MKLGDKTYANQERTYKVAVAGVFHETNSFAPGRTNLNAFRAEWIIGKHAFFEKYSGTRTSMGGVIDAAHLEHVELIPTFYTQATPSGMVDSETAETIIQQLVESLGSEEFDGMLVVLHGAMVAEHYFDMEGEILRRIRKKKGRPFPLAVTLDLHANIGAELINSADIIVGYDTYPHVDVYDRAIEAFQLLVKLIRTEISPVMAWSKPSMLLIPQTMVTSEGAMLTIMNLAFEIEQDPRILNVTVAGGFPYSDVPDAGMTFVVTADGDIEIAEKYARQLAKEAWDQRNFFQVSMLAPEEAIGIALEQQVGPIILIEGSDNVGGGSPADATHILQHLIHTPCKSLIVICDDEVVIKAHQLGVGRLLQCKVGGKTDNLHGTPVYIEGFVRTLFDGNYRHVGPYMTGQLTRMGMTAVIECEYVTLIITEHRVPPWDLGHVQSVGLNPNDFHIITVKSAVAWKTAFGTFAKKAIDVDTPGCCRADLRNFAYRELKRPIFPLDLE